MQSKEFFLPELMTQPVSLPADIQLIAPTDSQLPKEQQHFLLYIPWDDKYLQLVPTEFRDFFEKIRPQLAVRTTDVHTAISVSYLDELLGRIDKPMNRRAVAIALLLHDIGWSQLSEAEVAQSLGVTGLVLTKAALGPKEKHAVEGEKIARTILRESVFTPSLSDDEINLICLAVLYHDKPGEVAGAEQPMPLEVQVLVDLDHLWSFTHQNFWQDTVRKGVAPSAYLQNLTKDLEGYFVTEKGKALARELLAQRAEEVAALAQI